MRRKFPVFPFPPHQPGSTRLSRSQIEEQKKRAVRDFEALQHELERLRERWRQRSGSGSTGRFDALRQRHSTTNRIVKAY